VTAPLKAEVLPEDCRWAVPLTDHADARAGVGKGFLCREPSVSPSPGPQAAAIVAGMRRYIAGIEVTSDSLTLDGVSAVLGLAPTSGGSRGDRDAVGGVWDCTVWRFDPTPPAGSSLDDHLRAAFATCPASDALGELRALDPAASIRLRVAAIYTTLTCTVAIRPDWVRRAAAAGLEIEVSTYPAEGS